MTVDDKGRFYCGDQGGKGIFRITFRSGAPKVEKIPADISGAQGLLWAFDSLYVCLNGGKPGSGLYRVTDSNGDDQLDKIETLRKILRRRRARSARGRAGTPTGKTCSCSVATTPRRRSPRVQGFP